MMFKPIAVAATALLLAGAAGSAPAKTPVKHAAAAKSRTVAATRTVTLDLTGLD